MDKYCRADKQTQSQGSGGNLAPPVHLSLDCGRKLEHPTETENTQTTHRQQSCPPWPGIELRTHSNAHCAKLIFSKEQKKAPFTALQSESHICHLELTKSTALSQHFNDNDKSILILQVYISVRLYAKFPKQYTNYQHVLMVFYICTYNYYNISLK